MICWWRSPFKSGEKLRPGPTFPVYFWPLPLNCVFQSCISTHHCFTTFKLLLFMLSSHCQECYLLLILQSQMRYDCLWPLILEPLSGTNPPWTMCPVIYLSPTYLLTYHLPVIYHLSIHLSAYIPIYLPVYLSLTQCCNSFFLIYLFSIWNVRFLRTNSSGICLSS